ncbi:MAG: VRR-NUC domain-containing protein [Giesbergeria sp.]
MPSTHHFYYLHNFLFAMDWLRARYEDVLDEPQRRFLSEFQQLPLLAQALLVRLLLRRGPWFLQGKLAYEEIPDLCAAAAPLLERGFLEAQHPMGLDALFALHTKAELLPLFPCAPIHAAMRKPQMLEALRAQHPVEQTYSAWNPQSQQDAWRVMVGELCERLRLMFFGNLHQSWAEFVLADLGIFKYEKVQIDEASRVFERRADVDCYLAIHRCRQALGAGEMPETLLLEAARCSSPNPWLEARRAKLLLRIGQACERAQDWELAQQAYDQCGYAGARHRRMRVLERTGRFVEAFALAQTADVAPESEEESQLLARMLPRLQRRLEQTVGRGGVHQPAVPTVREDIALEKPVEPTPVEFLLRDCLHSEPAPVFYVENALINSLFGLLCWPAIFAPLPGAFFHPFQSGPADLGAPDFVLRRKAEFDACLALLADGRYRGVIRQRFVDKHGVQSPFVFWGALTPELLDLALGCIPAEHLGLIFKRMLAGIKANRTGFPDLVRFWPAERRYALVEVKGPGDKLQDNQIRWLHYFSEHGIPASVCHVRWRETPEAQQAKSPDGWMVGT